ncbi:MAG: hypothetical protein A3K19_16765 [Lentisphaerae bacterium RIFOXYB12_FULL_65_16]|nr:MAG: hypothetical protein A3K18_26645 [Lentisphaerae bacterium RIFOXYA12_64_32]OGV88972.1 MAG: hypothetical protein A3K19_16765 [Lentisphaerae bacterium RIFOXYB12_FULL_65_16]
MSGPYPPIGTRVEELDTPALLLDLDALERNLRRMADLMMRFGMALRPHVKTHKCSIIGQLQMQAGAIGLTCAKLGEAEVMADAGLRHLLIANQVEGRIKVQRLIALAARSEVIVAVENVRNAQEIAAAATTAGVCVDVIIEVDTGMSRCGVLPGPDTLALAQAIVALPGLRFRGLMGYEGHVVLLKSETERRRLAEESVQRLLGAAADLRAAGLEVEIVSAGGTGTTLITGQAKGITDIQAGSYVVMDATYRQVLPEFENALFILASVMSRRNGKYVVLDMGKKAATEEFGLPVLRDMPGARLVGLSEEHAKVELTDPHGPLRIGDKVWVIPSHCCTTINLHDEYFCVRGGRLEAIWPIDARGKVR